MRTTRWTVLHSAQDADAWRAATSAIILGWHAQILLQPSGWSRYLKTHDGGPKDLKLMISASRDGNPLVFACQQFGIGAVRGSSRNPTKKTKDKGGRRALVEALRHLSAGGAIGVTPDGPRGPAETVSDGAAFLAIKSGAPVVPYAILSKGSVRLSTWDRFHMPLPFSRGVMVFGEAVSFAPTTTIETAKTCLQAALAGVNSRAAEAIGDAACPNSQR